MAFIRHETYTQPGAAFSPVIPLEGGVGKDFAFKIYRRAWDDRRMQRLSCAALNPTGAATSLFLHIDFPVLTQLEADGTASMELLHDTVNLVLYDNGDWKNKRSLIEFLCSHYELPDEGAEFVGPKPVDLVRGLHHFPHLRSHCFRRCGICYAASHAAISRRCW